MSDLKIDGAVVDGVSGVLREAGARLPVTVTGWAQGCGSVAVEQAAAHLLSWVQVETSAREAGVASLGTSLRTAGSTWESTDRALSRGVHEARPR